MTVVALVGVVGGFALVLLVTLSIVADVFAGTRRRRALGPERTAGWVVRVRGPLRDRAALPGADREYVEVVAEYYTRRGEGPFEVTRRLPATGRPYAEQDRVIVSYDVRAPRRSRIEGRVTHWPQSGPRPPSPVG